MAHNKSRIHILAPTKSEINLILTEWFHSPCQHTIGTYSQDQIIPSISRGFQSLRKGRRKLALLPCSKFGPQIHQSLKLTSAQSFSLELWGSWAIPYNRDLNATNNTHNIGRKRTSTNRKIRRRSRWRKKRGGARERESKFTVHYLRFVENSSESEQTKASNRYISLLFCFHITHFWTFPDRNPFDMMY